MARASVQIHLTLLLVQSQTVLKIQQFLISKTHKLSTWQ